MKAAQRPSVPTSEVVMQATPVEIGDWISQYSDEPEKVREFCIRHGIIDHLRTAVELARRNFPAFEKLSLTLYKTLDDEAERPRIFVQVRSGLVEALAGYDRFLRDWVAAAPTSERDRIIFTYIIS